MADYPKKPTETEQAQQERMRPRKSTLSEEPDTSSQITPIELDDASEPPRELLTSLESEQEKIRKRTALMLLELGSHTLVLGLSLGAIWLIHLILEDLLGHEAKFFDLLPVRWIIDVADLGVIGKFLWEALGKYLWEIYKNIRKNKKS